MTVAHLTLELGAGDEGSHRIDDQNIDCARADQRVCDLEGLLAGIGLGNQQFVDIDPELASVARVEGMLRVDERARPTAALALGNHVQREGGLTGALRPVDLDDAATRQSADAERDIEAERARRDNLGFRRGLMRPELHNRALAKGALDLRERRVQSPLLVHRFLVQKAQRRLHHPASLISQSARSRNARPRWVMYTVCSGMQSESEPDIMTVRAPSRA